MNKSSFWTVFFLLHLFFIFVKIYQHNIYVNEVFKTQKLSKQKSNLRLNIDKLRKKILSAQNKQNLLEEAKELKMQPVTISQVSSL